MHTPEYFEKKTKNFWMDYKLYQIRQEGLEVTNEELDELILYFTSLERYDYCGYLKNLKNNKTLPENINIKYTKNNQ